MHGSISGRGGEVSDEGDDSTEAGANLGLEADEGGKREEATLGETAEEDAVVAAGLTVSSHEDLVLGLDDVLDRSDGLSELSLVDGGFGKTSKGTAPVEGEEFETKEDPSRSSDVVGGEPRVAAHLLTLVVNIRSRRKNGLQVGVVQRPRVLREKIFVIRTSTAGTMQVDHGVSMGTGGSDGVRGGDSVSRGSGHKTSDEIGKDSHLL